MSKSRVRVKDPQAYLEDSRQKLEEVNERVKKRRFPGPFLLIDQYYAREVYHLARDIFDERKMGLFKAHEALEELIPTVAQLADGVEKGGVSIGEARSRSAMFEERLAKISMLLPDEEEHSVTEGEVYRNIEGAFDQFNIVNLKRGLTQHEAVNHLRSAITFLEIAQRLSYEGGT